MQTNLYTINHSIEYFPILYCLIKLDLMKNKTCLSQPIMQSTPSILAIANKKKIPGCYVSRCYVGSCGGNIVSGARAGVTSEAWMYMYVYLNWFTFIIVRPVQWQPRKNDPFGLLITIKCELETWERCKR